MAFVWDEITSKLASTNDLLKGSYCAAHETKKETKNKKQQQQWQEQDDWKYVCVLMLPLAFLLTC